MSIQVPTSTVRLSQQSCPVCVSEKRRVVPAVHRWNEIDWQHIRCIDCNHRYTDPVPTEADLERMYDRSYFDEGGAWVCGYWGGSYKNNEANLRHEAQHALKDLPVRSGRLLEVGPAGGYFLDEARKIGFDVTGIEINPEMADFGRSHLGLNIYTGLFEEAPLVEDSFDVVVMQDVLEHVRDPLQFLTAAVKLLKPGGYLFLRGPLEECWRERVYQGIRTVAKRGASIADEPPFHLQGFTQRSLQDVIARVGLHVIRMHVVPEASKYQWKSAKQMMASLLEWTTYQLDKHTGLGVVVTLVAQK